MSRRSFLEVAASAALAASFPGALLFGRRAVFAGDALDPLILEPGDLIWPKKPGVWVPYEVEAEWTRERDAYLRSHEGAADPETAMRLRLLAKMEYGDVARADGSFRVGHVGIIDFDGHGDAWIIEAVGKEGVRRIPFVEWMKLREGELLWLGRLRNHNRRVRARLAFAAREQVGKPYDFWNFDLNDDSGFYCSKLVWCAVYRGMGIAVDGEPRSNRMLWFSPKQLLQLSAIDRIHDSGPYGTAALASHPP